MTRNTRKRLAVAALPVTAYLALMVLIAALWTHPPLLGWVGLGVLALVGALLIAAAFVLLPRTRWNAGLDGASGRREGVLVYAGATSSASDVSAAVGRHRHGGSAPVRVIAPLRPEPLDYVAGDEEAGRVEAQQRLGDTLAALRADGIPASGSVAGDGGIHAIADALVDFPASDLVVVTSGDGDWLEDGLIDEARLLVPSVEQVVIPRPPRPAAWGSIDKTLMSPAERRFVEESVEGHHADEVVRGTFGGGNPNRLLDFPDGAGPR